MHSRHHIGYPAYTDTLDQQQYEQYANDVHELGEPTIYQSTCYPEPEADELDASLDEGYSETEGAQQWCDQTAKPAQTIDRGRCSKFQVCPDALPCVGPSGASCLQVPYPPSTVETREGQTRALYNPDARSPVYTDYAILNARARQRWLGPQRREQSLDRQRHWCREPSGEMYITDPGVGWKDPYTRDLLELEHRAQGNPLLAANIKAATLGCSTIGRQTTWISDPEEPEAYRDPIEWTANLNPLITDRIANYGQSPDPTQFYRSRQALIAMQNEDHHETRDPYLRLISSTALPEAAPRTDGVPPKCAAQQSLAAFFQTLA